MNDQIDYKKVRKGIKEIVMPFIPFCIAVGLAFGLIPLNSIVNGVWIGIISINSLWLGLPIMKYYERQTHNTNNGL